MAECERGDDAAHLRGGGGERALDGLRRRRRSQPEPRVRERGGGFPDDDGVRDGVEPARAGAAKGADHVRRGRRRGRVAVRAPPRRGRGLQLPQLAELHQALRGDGSATLLVAPRPGRVGRATSRAGRVRRRGARRGRGPARGRAATGRAHRRVRCASPRATSSAPAPRRDKRQGQAPPNGGSRRSPPARDQRVAPRAPPRAAAPRERRGPRPTARIARARDPDATPATAEVPPRAPPRARRHPAGRENRAANRRIAAVTRGPRRNARHSFTKPKERPSKSPRLGREKKSASGAKTFPPFHKKCGFSILTSREP